MRFAPFLMRTAKYGAMMLLTTIGACCYLRICGPGGAISCARVRTLDSTYAVASLELRAVRKFRSQDVPRLGLHNVARVSAAGRASRIRLVCFDFISYNDRCIAPVE